jgi:hypothetical protein
MDGVVTGSPLNAKYGTAVDRESAYERLAARMAPPTPAASGTTDAPAPAEKPRGRGKASAAEDAGVVGAVLSSPMFKSFARSAASALGREVTRGLFGNRRRR